MSEITYHLFGDSHAGKHINHPNIKRYPMPAASAMGLNNPKSFSGSQKKFLDIYNKISKNDKIMLKYGQVDTEYVYYMNSQTLVNSDDVHEGEKANEVYGVNEIHEANNSN